MHYAARRGMWLRALIVAAELGGFFFFGSDALLLDGLASLIDIGASFLLLLCIYLADRPPDRGHPHGHGRFEPLAGVQIGILILVLGLWTAFQQIRVVVGGDPRPPISPYGWMIPLLAAVLLELCYRSLKKTAQKENSPAMLADAMHYRMDALASSSAVIALCLGAFFPRFSHLFDHLGAFGIALIMCGAGAVAIRQNVAQLLDRIPSDHYFDLVRSAALSVEGIRATEKLKLQVYGPDAQVAIDVEVDDHLSVAEAHRLSQRVRRRIQEAWPSVRDVIVHIEPYYPGDHDEG